MNGTLRKRPRRDPATMRRYKRLEALPLRGKIALVVVGGFVVILVLMLLDNPALIGL
jgi:hypothetical protein